MLLPLIDAEGNPLRKPLRMVAAITAASLLTIALPTLAGDGSSDTEETEETEETDTKTEYGVSYYGGVTQMLPAEYFQHSAPYGDALYRRYIEQVRDKNTHQIVAEKKGKIIQEYYVSHEMLKAVAPSLLDRPHPKGLQNLGIVAVKLWLKRAHEGTPDDNACLFKPKSSLQPEHLLPEGTMPQKTRSWVRHDFETDDDLRKCGLSLRLTADFSELESAEGEEDKEVFMHGKLCRYPYGRKTFNAEQDDAECQEISKISLAPEDILLLSEEHERRRAHAAIRRAEKEADSQAASYVPTFKGGPIEPQPVGTVLEMFGQFLTPLNVITYGGSDEPHLNPSYVRKVSGAEYEEKVVRQDISRNKFTKLKGTLGVSFAEALDQDPNLDLKDAGIEQSVGEFYLKKAADRSKPTFTMKIETDKAITFEDEVNDGESIALLNLAHMERYVRDVTELATFKTKAEECAKGLIECKAASDLLKKRLERIPELEAEKEALQERLDKKDGEFEKELNRLQKLSEATGDASAVSARAEQKAIDDALLERERKKNMEALEQLEKDYKADIKKLTDQHDVAAEKLRQEKSQQTAAIQDLEARGSFDKSEIDRLKSQVKERDDEIKRESEKYDNLLSLKLASYKEDVAKLETKVEALQTFKQDALQLEKKANAASSYQMAKMKSAYDAQIALMSAKLQDWESYDKQGFTGSIERPYQYIPTLKVNTYLHENGTTVFREETDYSDTMKKDEL